ncbi:MAG: DUF6607 family protein [Methylophilaceae bacterium]
MKRILYLLLIFFTSFSFSNESTYVFGWTQQNNPDLSTPIGGITVGAEVSLDNEPNPLWLELQKPNISKFEKDRLAILSMAGNYRVYFDFMETMGFVKNYKPQQPYQSWATEYVSVIEDKDDFISLQHITVMYFKQKDGQISDPVVMKHWRQDWKYEDNEISTYAGNRTWTNYKIPYNEQKGIWTQSVFQVDDSPRYQGYGQWIHYPNYSSWASNETWRPLPRREFSVRDDYDVMIGNNIQTITPTGWVHEQNNKKVVLADNKKVLAKEIGIGRYERIKDFNWEAGLEYWGETQSFWKEVRFVINNKLNNTKTFKLKASIDGVPMWNKLFMMADNYTKDKVKLRNDIEKIINSYSF